MLHFLPGPIVGSLSFLLYLANTLFWMSPLIPLTLIKLIIPLTPVRDRCNRLLDKIATNWISVNVFNHWLTSKTDWDVRGLEGLQADQWYLVLSNHQSWVDILVLQKVFNRKIPFLKFFIKKELIWVPIMGPIWWALDYPFMKRYSRQFLKKNPHLKGKDIAITRRACQKFKTIPVSIMNFVEGTRFSREKHQKQGSPYTHLLKPRAGGVAFVLGAMGEQLHRILNVTIVYPQGAKSFWAFLCGKVADIRVRVEQLPVTADMLGDYVRDSEFRENFQQWINTLWAEKDRCIENLLNNAIYLEASPEEHRIEAIK